MNKKPKELVFIYRQEIIQDISLFTSAPKAKFYDELFIHLDLEEIVLAHAKTGRKSKKEALLCSFIVMKCEGFSQITELVDFLNNNLIIAHYCGFNIMKKLPSYSTFERFIKNLDNSILKKIMQAQVLKLAELGVIDTSFIGLDSTPVFASTCNNNHKSFNPNKFKKNNTPKADTDCGLGVHSASNKAGEKNFDFYWGYKNHVLTDCITGLPICEITTPANVADSTVASEILKKTNAFLSINECSFIADKGYDVSKLYEEIKATYNGDCFIPINPRGSKDYKKINCGAPLCEAGLAMHRDGKFVEKGITRQKFCCPFKRSSHLHDCPFNHKSFKKGSKATGCTKYYTVPEGYRHAINRNSIQFKSIYALRSECERYNSRFKSTGQERLWVRNGKSAENLNTLAHISLLAIATAAFVTGKQDSFRSLKSVKRIA